MTSVASHQTSRLAASWLGQVDLQAIVSQVGSPVFVYDAGQLVSNLNRVRAAAEVHGLADRVKLYVPFFPNSNPHLLQPLKDAGAGLLLQVPAEYEITTEFGFDDFIVSPGHISDEEIDYWSALGFPTFYGSLGEVERALAAHAPTISVRIDSLDSGKPGIKLAELDDLQRLLESYSRTLECFEVYCGSGNSREAMTQVIDTMFRIFTERFPETKSVNFAGGHGFEYEPWSTEEKHFAWDDYLGTLRELANLYAIPDHVLFLFEPARDILADVGSLVLGVKRDVIRTTVHDLIATDGSRMLMPSAQLRQRNHNVVFLDDQLREFPSDTPTAPVNIRGRTILRNDYILPSSCDAPESLKAGDHLIILDTGAYCATQHMEFLNVPPAAEVMISTSGEPQLITTRGSNRDKWRNLRDAPKPLGATEEGFAL